MIKMFLMRNMLYMCDPGQTLCEQFYSQFSREDVRAGNI